jgi:hypothetical protein
MRQFVLFFFLIVSCIGFSQSSKKVVIKFSYKGNPLCYWDVTLKYGDAEIAKAKTNDKGIADFGTVRLLSNGVDAYGYKKTPNGEKKWDVKGVIAIAESGTTNFDFEPLVNEMGMGSMLEAAWGLTLNDCAREAVSSSANNASNTTSTPSTGIVKQEEEKSDFDLQMDAARAKQKADMEQRQADWESGKTQAEQLQHSKATYENRITSATNKIAILNQQLAKKTAGTKEYSELQYEIRETEIDRDLNQVKLDKTNRQIAKGNAPLSKSEREDLSLRDDLLSQEADSLKAAKKSGALYGNAAQSSSKETIEKVESKEAEKIVIKEVATEKETTKEESVTKSEPETDDSDVLKIASNEELTGMSLIGLKKLKMDSSAKLTNRKVTLKTKKPLMKTDKIVQVETEIIQLEDLIKRIDEELGRRNGGE